MKKIMIFVLLGCAAYIGYAEVPDQVSYEGRLLNADGSAVNGAVPIAVCVYTAQSGGELVYTQHIGSVTVADGLYSFSWGATSLMPALTNDQCWLETHINGETMSPRTRLLAVPYARKATYCEELEGMNLSDVLAAASPPGIISPYAGSTPPAGWLLCDGSAVSRDDYAGLFAAIGTTYGAGDGSTTFHVPNLKGRVIVGVDAADSQFDQVGEAGGAKTHTLSVDEMPSHNHGVNDPGHNHSLSDIRSSEHCTGSDCNWKTKSANNGSSYSTASSATGISIQNRGGGQPHNNLQPYVCVNYIIRY